MALITRYEDAAAAFLQAHPVGATVHGDELVKWAHDHADGLAPDLLIDDPTKKLSAIRRHLNTGGSSRAFAETDRFYLDTTDAKRKVFVVRKLSDHVSQRAEAAFGKSVTGAISPLKQSQKAIRDIRLEDLDEKGRAMLEAQMQELVEHMKPLRKLLNQSVIARWVLRLEKNGYTKAQAKNLVELLPQLQREMKLIKATTDDEE